MVNRRLVSGFAFLVVCLAARACSFWGEWDGMARQLRADVAGLRGFGFWCVGRRVWRG